MAVRMRAYMYMSNIGQHEQCVSNFSTNSSALARRTTSGIVIRRQHQSMMQRRIGIPALTQSCSSRTSRSIVITCQQQKKKKEIHQEIAAGDKVINNNKQSLLICNVAGISSGSANPETESKEEPARLCGAALRGRPLPFGATACEDNGVNFAVHSSGATAVSLCLFTQSDLEQVRYKALL